MKASRAAIRTMRKLRRIDNMLTFLVESMGYTVFADGVVVQPESVEEIEAAESGNDDSELDEQD